MKKIVLIFFISFSLQSCYNTITPKDTGIQIYQILGKFGTKVKTKHLNPEGIGGGSENGKINCASIDFHYDKPLTIGDARKLLVPLAYQLLADLNAETTLKDDVAIFPLEISNIKMCISSDHSTKAFDSSRHIICVSLNDGFIYYHTSLTSLVFEKESFEEAERILQNSE